MTDESGVEERFYGSLGETTRKVKSVDAKTPSAQRKSYATDYVFDSFGRMNQMTYPDGETLYGSHPGVAPGHWTFPSESIVRRDPLLFTAGPVTRT